jgi:hypothetical protein
MNEKDRDEVRDLIGEALGKHRETRHPQESEQINPLLRKRIEEIEKILEIRWVLETVQAAHYEPIQISKKK